MRRIGRLRWLEAAFVFGLGGLSRHNDTDSRLYSMSLLHVSNMCRKLSMVKSQKEELSIPGAGREKSPRL